MTSDRGRSSAKRPNRLDRAVKVVWRKLSPSRRPATESKEQDRSVSTDIKGPLGLDNLHDPDDPIIDFIFVHGLGGGSRKTWSVSGDPEHFWPKAWLSQEVGFSSVRIHSFGYPADWYEWKRSTLTILDFARSLLGDISWHPKIRKSNTKIVLIGHSMGGIVIKKAYMLAREDPDFKDLATRIHTLYFLATPHRGSDYSKLFANILSVSYGVKPFVSELSRDSDSIANINDSFRHFSNDVQLWSFYETDPINFIITQPVIVDKSSATLGYANETSLPLKADHRGVCKFHFRTDPNYQTLRNSFSVTIDKILLDRSRSLPPEHDQLVELTGISELPDNELSALEDIRMPGSCDWFVTREVYKSWQEAQPGSRPFLWLTGNAGFGKSVLSSRIVHELQQNRLGCSYFFFKYGNSHRSNTVGCLRALAYQMAIADNSVLQRLVAVQKTSPAGKEWNEKTLWRKLFLGCIFKDTNFKTQYWVIDAVDECQKCQLFLNLLITAPPCLRIFFTSRENPHTKSLMDGIIKNVEHYRLKEEDTINDFSKFIESRMDHVPVSDGENRGKLRQRILEKASGSFLWVSLVIQRLEDIYSEEQAEAVLSEVPTDMNEFYAEMLGSLHQKDRQAVQMAGSVYMWTTLSLRPLKIEALQFALRMERHTIPNLERDISRISGQLVKVNQRHEVEVIHQTAKEYLLQQDSYSDFAIHKIQCHSRIAQTCLTLLIENLAKENHVIGSKKPRVPSITTPPPDFMDYACEYFSDHLQKSSSGDDKNWDLLCKFLDSNALIWIEHLARKKSLRSVTLTAKNLQAYFRRRLKYLHPISPQRGSTESWIYDLLRLSAKFGTHLNISPASIRNLIPVMCPSQSLISKFYAARLSKTGLSIKGMTDSTWDDCLVRVNYPAQRTSAIACGEQYSAVALSDGTIYIYFQESTLVKHSLKNDERANILAFSSEDRYLASSGLKKISLWDPVEGSHLWAFDMTHESLALTFVQDEDTLVAATKGNYTVHWDLHKREEIGRWQWTDSLQGTTHEQKNWGQPNKALFSPNHAALAVSYRRFPLYLFDVTTQQFLGCFNRDTTVGLTGASNLFVVDGLAFNPSSEINILVASYGDGELAVYDVESTLLRYRSPNVFANCLKCSPDGRTLVTGSANGVLQIFEFAGIGGERLLPLYKIKVDEDEIKDIAFASGSLRFADIRGAGYRIWEPAVLACNDLDEGSQSEISHAVSMDIKEVDIVERPLDPEIIAMCCSAEGNFVFCGNTDGSVSYFETNTACLKGTLYRHVKNIEISCIAFIEARSLLVSADESGRVLINQIMVSKERCEFLASVAEIRSEDSLSAILPSHSGMKLLLIGRGSASLWTTEGKRVGATIFFSDEDEIIFTNHPLYSEHLVSIARGSIRVFSWTDAREASPSLGTKEPMDLTITPPTPTQTSDHSEEISSSFVEQWSPPFLTFNSKRNPALVSGKHPTLQIWPASSIVASGPSPPSVPLLSFTNHFHRIRRVISVAGSVVYFLDLDLWVCSLDITSISSISNGARRHFFLLSEWQTIYGGFIIEYVPTTGEFLVARKHEVLVVSRGLKFGEPWIS